VIVYLRKGRLSSGTSRKQRNKKYGPYKVLKKINNNAYVIDFPEEVAIFPTFNLIDILNIFHNRSRNITRGEVLFKNGKLM
jgi:hypothetical protein